MHDLAAKLDTAGIYTQAEIDQCAEAFVTGKGNNALAAAIDPGKKRFAERYQAALIDNGGEGDKAALAELDMFRKDVGSFVRLYDFMSQIIDYGDPALEKKQIYLRNLDRVIQPRQLHRTHRPVRRGAQAGQADRPGQDRHRTRCAGRTVRHHRRRVR